MHDYITFDGSHKFDHDEISLPATFQTTSFDKGKMNFYYVEDGVLFDTQSEVTYSIDKGKIVKGFTKTEPMDFSGYIEFSKGDEQFSSHFIDGELQNITHYIVEDSTKMTEHNPEKSKKENKE